jgi:hypothetical protein
MMFRDEFLSHRSDEPVQTHQRFQFSPENLDAFMFGIDSFVWKAKKKKSSNPSGLEDFFVATDTTSCGVPIVLEHRRSDVNIEF